jgi:VanZ family protein
MRSARKTRWAAGAYLLLLTTLSVLPSGRGPLKDWDASLSPSLQNALHAPAYAVLVCLALSVVADLTPVHMWTIAAVAAGCVGYGVVLECVQAAGIPGRTGSVTDVLWNATGVAVGIVVWKAWPRTLRAWGVFSGKFL